jgi:DNA-binding response OmpR family regulator
MVWRAAFEANRLTVIQKASARMEEVGVSGTILVVDDQPATVAGVTEFLAYAGYDTVSADTFETAVQLLDENEPDLLIADVRLGARNGIGLLIAARARHPGLRTIIVTGYPDPVLENEARQEGAAAFLIKPLTSEAFLATVAETLRASGRHRRWFRKSIKPGLEAMIDQQAATIVDLSYGGAKLDVAARDAYEPPDTMQLSLPTMDVTVPARKVWARSSNGTVLCGIAIEDVPAAEAWYSAVDIVSGRHPVGPPIHNLPPTRWPVRFSSHQRPPKTDL